MVSALDIGFALRSCCLDDWIEGRLPGLNEEQGRDEGPGWFVELAMPYGG